MTLLPVQNAYSTSNFDILGIFGKLALNPPSFPIGPVDLSCAFCVTDPSLPDNPIIYVSPSFEKLTEYDEKEIVGQNCRFLQSPVKESLVDQPRKYCDSLTAFHMRQSLEDQIESQVVILNYTKSGVPFLNLVTMIPIELDEPNGKHTYFLGLQCDIGSKAFDKVAQGPIRVSSSKEESWRRRRLLKPKKVVTESSTGSEEEKEEEKRKKQKVESENKLKSQGFVYGVQDPSASEDDHTHLTQVQQTKTSQNRNQNHSQNQFQTQTQTSLEPSEINSFGGDKILKFSEQIGSKEEENYTEFESFDEISFKPQSLSGDPIHFISQLTLDGVYIYISPSSSILLGKPVEEFIGQSFFDSIHPDDIETTIVMIDQLKNSEILNSEPILLRFKKIDNSVVPLITNFTAYENPIQKQKQILLRVRDS